MFIDNKKNQFLLYKFKLKCQIPVIIATSRIRTQA